MSSSKAEPEALLAALEWRVLRRLDGFFQGDYRSLFRGFGMDLADLREYEYGDDLRFIDWNVTARLSTPYVRRFDEDREITAFFLLDLSPSVDFGSGEVKKIDLLIEAVGLLSRILTRHGNRVGALLYDGGAVELLPARGGRDQVLALLKRLQTRPRPTRAPPTDLGLLLGAALEVLRRRSLVFLVSDFITAPGWPRRLSLLCRRHEVLALRLRDPSEEVLPDLGITRVSDAETGEELWVDTHDRGFRARFSAAARLREEGLRADLARAEVDCLELVTGEDLAAAILRFAGQRTARARLSGGGRPGSVFGRRA
jgi:uncharacterized protein (DUF58 family)